MQLLALLCPAVVELRAGTVAGGHQLVIDGLHVSKACELLKKKCLGNLKQPEANPGLK